MKAFFRPGGGLNDYWMPLASAKNRHEKIGVGTIGEEALYKLVHHPKLSHLPFFLETPNELDGYADEIRRMRSIR